VQQPCDEAVGRSGSFGVPGKTQSGTWVLAATILGSSMAFIDGTVVNVALPALQSSLHATVVDVQWVVESYGLFLSALLLIGGAMGDSVGRRFIFLLGTGVFAAASVGCGLSSNISQLIAARCIQGIGAAFLVPSSLAIISACFDEKSRGQAIGTWSGFTAITTALGPVLGGWLIEHASWHWAFFINVPLAVGVIAISLWHVPESRSSIARRVDWLGAAVATVGLAGIVFGFIESARLGWSHPLVFGTLILGIAALVVFVFIEKQAVSPMVPLSLFRSSSFTGANLLTLLLYAALGIFFFLFPLNLVQAQKYSTTATGAAALPFILLMFALSRWSGGLVARYGPKAPLIAGPLIAAAGFLLFALPSVGVSYWMTFFPAFVVLGFGMAVSVAPLTTVVMSSVDETRVGAASGINNAVSRVAGVLAVAVLGIVMVTAFSHRLQHSISTLDLAPAALDQIQSSAIRLGGLEVPRDLDERTSSALRGGMEQAFVFGFRLIMFLCAGLAVAGAAVASRMIPSSTGGRVSGVGGVAEEETEIPRSDVGHYNGV
jgi:EmrB/QacA subfamily drug resistance transporter